jgi:hypothetical protein
MGKNEKQDANVGHYYRKTVGTVQMTQRRVSGHMTEIAGCWSKAAGAPLDLDGDDEKSMGRAADQPPSEV